MWANGYWNCVVLSTNTPRGRFKSEYWFKGRRYDGGIYKTALEAARASDKGLYQLGAAPERLHFPNEFTHSTPEHARKRRHVHGSERDTEASTWLKSDDQRDGESQPSIVMTKVTKGRRRGRHRDLEEDDAEESEHDDDVFYIEDDEEGSCSEVESECRLKTPTKRRRSAELESTSQTSKASKASRTTQTSKASKASKASKTSKPSKPSSEDKRTPTLKRSPRRSALSSASASVSVKKNKKPTRTSTKTPELVDVTAYEACKLKTLEFQSQCDGEDDAWTIDELLSVLYMINHNNCDEASLGECLDNKRSTASINRIVVQMPARSAFAKVTMVLDLRTGDQITIFFKSDRKWFTGIVDETPTSTGICCVSFPDGDCKYFALDRHGWKWLLWKRSSEREK